MPAHCGQPEVKRYDVVIATDLKLPGGTTASVAEEVRAQASAGYRTGLVHVPSPLSLGIGGLNPRIAAVLATGAADLLARDASAHARLVVFRHPGVFAQVPPAWPRLTADAAVVVVNQPPVDESGAGRFYALDEVEAVVARLAGIPSGWIPIGPLVREAVMRDRPDLTMVDWDWTNVLHPDEWAVDRPPLEGRKPVIGRHSRPQLSLIHISEPTRPY